MFKLNFCISTPKFHPFRITIFFYAFIIKKWIDTKLGENINTKMIFLRRKLNVNTNSLPVPKIYRQIQTFERKRVIFRERLKLLPSKVFTKLLYIFAKMDTGQSREIKRSWVILNLIICATQRYKKVKFYSTYRSKK